ncbi:hypothetical protein [Candidatus Pelagibacter bacterium nBUS_25]|uniref:hypothetical protein n=1 Tax=Candidatus Pelagibacter bacterium nBUS_25 TaxID=3374187 RepID=UPI003EB76266
MFKILILNIFVFFILNFSYAEISYVDVKAKGKSETYEVSLKKALKEAITKVNGVTLKTESVLEIIDKSLTTNESSTASLGRNLNEKISEKSGGSIKSFEILNEYEDFNGLQVIEIRATVAKYKLSKTAKRKRMAIVPFRINLNEISIFGKTGFDDADNLRKYLNQEFTNYFVQTRKFTILDREFDKEISEELMNLENSQKIEDQIKIGQKLFADYIIVGRLDFLALEEVEKKFLTSDVVLKKKFGSLNFSYRIIDVPTGQIKYSSKVNLEVELKKQNQPIPYLFNLTAQKAGLEIMYAIYPILVEKIEDDLLYLGQGGNQIKVGDMFAIYERTDSKIKDSYTGETLGNIEKIVGNAIIIDSNSKFSVAQISEQKYDLIGDFKPRKFMVKPIKKVKKNKSSGKTKKKKKAIDQEW